MTDIAIAALLIFCVVCAPAHSEDTIKTRLAALKTWFQHFKEGLDESVVSDHYQKAEFTAVAAVRGAPQDSADPDKVYWKDDAAARKTAEAKKEKAELSAALAKVIAGDVKEGEAGIESFEKAHPKSRLIADAKQALAKAKELEEGK
jgi:hypothetical protein